MEINYHRLSLFKFAMLFLLTAHWMACLWHLVTVLEVIVDPNIDLNWVTLYNRHAGRHLGAPSELYVASLYWACVTMATIGYGDVVPATHIERIYVILAAVVGGGLYAYLVGAVCGIIARMDEANQAFIMEMDLLNRFLRAWNIPQALRVKLRDYVQFRWREKRVRGSNASDVMHSMSADLAAQVYTISHVPLLQQLYCFKHSSTTFLAALCGRLEAHMFSPEDMIVRYELLNSCFWRTSCGNNPATSVCPYCGDGICRAGNPVERMHIIERGMVMRAAKVHNPGHVVGEEMLISGRTANVGVITLTLVLTLAIELDSFKSVLQEFPAMQPIIQNIVRDVLKQGVRILITLLP
jgi:Ion channel